MGRWFSLEMAVDAPAGCFPPSRRCPDKCPLSLLMRLAARSGVREQPKAVFLVPLQSERSFWATEPAS